MTASAARGRAMVVFSVAAALALLPHDVGAGSGGFVAGSTKPCAAAAKAAAAAGSGGKWGLAAITAAAAAGVNGEAFAATPSPAPCVELRPQTSLNRETIPIGGPPRLYALKDLKRGTSYEVRVSYPATNPADFTIELINPTPGMKLEHPRPLGGENENRFNDGDGDGDDIASGHGKMTTTTGVGGGTIGSAATAGTSSFASSNPPSSTDKTSSDANVKKKKTTAAFTFVTTPGGGQDARKSNNKKKDKDSPSSSSATGDLRRALRRLLNVEKLVMTEGDVEEGTHADAGGGMGAAMVRILCFVVFFFFLSLSVCSPGCECDVTL